jgi:hypothetical protein
LKNTPETVAYVDDVTLFLRSPQEIPIVQQIIAFALGSWVETVPVMGLAYCPHIRILGVTFGKTTRMSADVSWVCVTSTIRTQAKDTYCRDLLLYQRIQNANVYLMAKAWFLAQILPSPKNTVRQVNSILSWCL